MSSRRARVDALTEDVSTLSEKVTQLYEDLETAVEAAEDAAETRADGGHAGWEEIETAGPDGEEDVETVEWTPVETE